MKILLRCAGRGCESSLYVPMDQGGLAGEVAKASWIFVRNRHGLQPVCWGCAEKLELSEQDLERVREFHALGAGKGASS